MFEHRLVMERELGRPLQPLEVVDHIDGLHLHNAPSNLRLFATNADHLRATISGQIPQWSEDGLARMRTAHHQRAGLERIDSYGQRKKRGEIRLLQILRAACEFGIDSPFLLGTHHHLERARIDYSSPTMIEQALRLLYP
ncbi:HNH endonuclease [Sphingomonas sp. 10B4]|nr:HNH endonuclease [Sphingomonas sp. 10B4]